ncbi:hypothetical protein VNI00_009399 [Paramarasmius palmivorus]|uniref:ATP synthase F0 subunit 8 n=1 Tax=Paramarasmius palmivorus TaxID=297713 RepID=A0AAW0CNR5_9AGAR
MAQPTYIIAAIELGTSTNASWLIIAFIAIAFLKWFRRYISLDCLNALSTDIKDLIADQHKKHHLPSVNIFDEAYNRLRDRVSRHKRVRYTIDEATWKTYIVFFMWDLWKEPLAIHWAAGKLRRRVLAEAEVERSALEHALESYRASRRRNVPLKDHVLPNV